MLLLGSSREPTAVQLMSLADFSLLSLGVGQMRTYFAISPERVVQNGFLACVIWAEQEAARIDGPVKIATARPEDRVVRIVGEVTSTGYSFSRAGRTIALKSVLSRCRKG